MSRDKTTGFNYFYEAAHAYPKLTQEQIEILYQKENIVNFENSLPRSDSSAEERILMALFGDKLNKEDNNTNKPKEPRYKTYTYLSASKNFVLSSVGRMVIKKRNVPFPSLELRNIVVCCNLWIAVYFAKQYYYKCDRKLELDDLVQTANEALVSAAKYYIPGGGC